MNTTKMNTTKKLCLLSLVAMMTITNVNAQEFENRHEIAVSYGWLSNSDVLNIYETLITAPFSGSSESKNETYYGPIGIEYFYRMDNLVSVGGVLVYGHMGFDLYEKKDGELQSRGEVSDSYFSVLPSAKFTWVNKEHFGFYSKVGAGFTYRSEKDDDIDYSDSKIHFNYQVTLAGIEAGGTQFRGFLDLGFGEQGIFCAGLRYKF